MPKKKQNLGKMTRRISRGYFAKPVSKKSYIKEARARAKMQYQPEIRALQAEKKSIKGRRRQARSWFNKYGQTVKQAAQGSQAGYTTAANQVNQTAQGAANYAEQLRQRMAQEDKSDAATRGVTPDSTGSKLNAQAQLARIGAANTLSSVISGQGAAQGAYLQDKRRIAKGAKHDTLFSLAGQKQQLKRDIAATKGLKGAYVGGEMSKAREAERNYFLGLQAARQVGKGRKFEAREGAKARAHQSRESAKQRRATRLENKRDRKFDKKHGSSSDSKGRSVPRGSITAYVGKNATKAQVQKNPNIAVKEVLNRWPYLDKKYVQKVVQKWASRRPKDRGKDGGLWGSVQDSIGK